LLLNNKFCYVSKTVLLFTTYYNKYNFSKEMFNLKNKKQSYNFDYLIMICKLYKLKNDKKGKISFEDSEIIWSNREEECFDEVYK